MYVPNNISTAHLVYDAVGDIACPANTGAQRLAQTNQPLDTDANTAQTIDPCAKK